MGRGWKNFEVHVRKSLDCLEEAIGINMNVKGNLVRPQMEIGNM